MKRKLMLDYKNLLKRIEEPVDDYYNILIDHASSICARIEKKGQVEVANELGMSQAKLSALKQFLEVLDEQERYYIYYVVYPNGNSKIGFSKDVATRLVYLATHYSTNNGVPYIESPFTTIRTFAFYEEQEARNAEKLIKVKYQDYVVDEMSKEHFSTDVLNAADLNTLYNLSIASK